jgi:hypothetical protein
MAATYLKVLVSLILNRILGRLEEKEKRKTHKFTPHYGAGKKRKILGK